MTNKKKNIKHKDKQDEILNTLLNILNYNGNYVFYLYDLENDETLRNKIMELKDDIKTYYPSSTCIGVNGKKCKRPYMSIIRYILTYNNKELYSCEHHIKKNNKRIRTKKYKII